MSDLTAQQAAFVAHLVADGCTPTEAARRAGYSHPAQEAYRLMRNAGVTAELAREQTRLIRGELGSLALATLRRVMEDDTAPASSRVGASRTVLEMCGRFKDPERPDAKSSFEDRASRMTPAELDAYIAEATARLGDETTH